MSDETSRLAPAPSHGFTLVELAIVLMILAILLWVSIPAYRSYIERTRLVDAIRDVGEMSKEIHKYEMAKGVLPDSLAEAGYPSKVDPWGFDYEYLNLRTSKGNGKARQDKGLKPLNSDFDLYSVGPDGITAPSLTSAASRDDVLRARDGNFIGTAQDFDP
jgi:general secretion pathway protein G